MQRHLINRLLNWNIGMKKKLCRVWFFHSANVLFHLHKYVRVGILLDLSGTSGREIGVANIVCRVHFFFTYNGITYVSKFKNLNESITLTNEEGREKKQRQRRQ